jgi:hypothetical protein
MISLTRGLRTSWLMVGIAYSFNCSVLNFTAIGEKPSIFGLFT